MHWITLPEPHPYAPLAFCDLSSAKAWLAGQPQAQAMHMLNKISQQIDAIQVSSLTPATAIELLNLLRGAAVPAAGAVEARFTRKPLPLLDDDHRCFEAAQQLWLKLGTAYLRLAPHFPPAEKALPLNRAACAFRMVQYCHFLAARECPVDIDRLLFAVLAQAESTGVLRHPLSDPDFRHLGDSHIAGHLAWAFLLRLIDPYRLSAAQFAVANRAISRWRELAGFQSAPDDDPRAHSLDLTALFGTPLPEGIPRWLEIRRVMRKIEQRLAALQSGEAPESLKLGRELSGAACIRLLHELQDHLDVHVAQSSTEIGELELAFGPDHAYAILTGEMPSGGAQLDSGSATLAHQRVAMFGFDRVSTLPTAVKKLIVPSEKWMLVDGKAVRAADAQARRRLAPCLIAGSRDGEPRLGILLGLRSLSGGGLQADLNWYRQRVEAGSLAGLPGKERSAAFIPAFLLSAGNNRSLIVPASAGVRLNSPLGLSGLPMQRVTPNEVLERGVDFVRYAIDPA